MRLRLTLLLVFAVLVASCGVSRDESAVDSPDDVAEDQETDGSSTDASADSPTETTLFTPSTTAPAADVAMTIQFADGTSTEMLHGALNDIVVPTQDNAEFVNLVYQGQTPPGFDAVVLSQSVLGQVMDNEMARLDIAASSENVDEARVLLFQQLQSLLTTSADPAADAQRLYDEVPYLPFIVDLQARQLALTNGLAETADPGEGSPCVRHILVETEEEGNALQTELVDGADFASLAIERSTGPSGPAGGDLGCAEASNYVPEFAAAVEGATLGEFVGPVQTEFGWHVLVVERYEVDGSQLAQALVNEALAGATVDVDERVGLWDPAQLSVVPAGS